MQFSLQIIKKHNDDTSSKSNKSFPQSHRIIFFLQHPKLRMQWIKQIFCLLIQYRMRRYQKEDKPTPNPNPKKDYQEAVSANKITLHFPSQTQHYDDDDSTSPVTIYLRSPSKQSHKIEVPSKISMTEIKQIAEEKMGIKKDQQMLHLNGKNVTEYGYIRLQMNNIIHITNCQEIVSNQEEISIKIKIINSYKENTNENKKYKIRANQSINDLLAEIKKEEGDGLNDEKQQPFYFLLESSRLLEGGKSFSEQDISKKTEIICLITKHELKTRFSNDTKEEILHDISQLLGFQEEPIVRKEEPKREQRFTRARYPREERKNSDTHDRFKTFQNKIINQVPQRPNEEQPNLNKTASNPVSDPSFKKQKASISKTYSMDVDRPLATKLKSSKSRKQLDLLLKSQQKPGDVFEAPEVIKELVKEQSKKEGDSQNETMEIHKPAPSIPKIMPVQERRKIRLQIEKLFDLGDTNTSQPANQAPQPKEQQKPKSPPTQQPQRPVQREKQKLRFSMGSRPAFLDQFKIAK